MHPAQVWPNTVAYILIVWKLQSSIALTTKIDFGLIFETTICQNFGPRRPLDFSRI